MRHLSKLHLILLSLVMQRVYDYLMTIKPTSVGSECAGLFATNTRSCLKDFGSAHVTNKLITFLFT